MYARIAVLSTVVLAFGYAQIAAAGFPQPPDGIGNAGQPVHASDAAESQPTADEPASDPAFAGGDDPSMPIAPLIAPQRASKPEPKPEPKGFQAKPALLQAGLFL